jgi:hypothetical protein
MLFKNQKIIYLSVVMLLLSGCVASGPKGVIVETIMPAKLDITNEASLEGDAVMQAIIIDNLRDSAGHEYQDKSISFYVRSALQKAMTETQVFNIRGPGSQMNLPRIRPVVEKFAVENDVVDAGYVTRRGGAAITFSLRSSSNNQVGVTFETAEVINRQPVGGQLRAREDILKEMAEDICRNFVRKIVPTPKKEFREFADGGQEVQNGIDAAMNKDWDLAIKIWKKVISQNSNNAPAIYNLGIAYEAKKMLRKALKQYEKARKKDSTNGLYQKNYAKLKKKLATSKKVNILREEVRDDSVSASD